MLNIGRDIPNNLGLGLALYGVKNYATLSVQNLSRREYLFATRVLPQGQ